MDESKRQLKELVWSVVHLSARTRDFAASQPDMQRALTPLREAIDTVSRTLSAMESACRQGADSSSDEQRPHLRDLEERFESRVLPLFARQSGKERAVLPEQYLEGLALRDFDRAWRGLLEDGGSLSPSTIAGLKSRWSEELDVWRQEPIDEEIVYLWADGIHVKAGLEKDKAALLVVIGVSADGVKRILAVEPGDRESTESWRAVFGGLVKRGMNVPKAVIADGGQGPWNAIAELGWRCKEQRCWRHKLQDVQDAVPYREQKRALKRLRGISNAKTVEEAVRRRNDFLNDFAAHPEACERLLSDWERMVAFYQLPKEHWRTTRTTNLVESPLKVVRLLADGTRRFKRVGNATAVIWKLLMIAEICFRNLEGSHALGNVVKGTEYKDGLPWHLPRRKAA